jgi:hypothetical protein
MPGAAVDTSERRFEPLPYTVYFIHPDREAWADVVDAKYPVDPDLIHARFSSSSDIWIIQTYLHLRRKGLDVRLESRPVRGAINVVMNYDLGIRQVPCHSYVVSCRADTFYPYISNHVIVQNPINASPGTDHFVPHWPQPGLIPRDASRGSRVEVVGYMGHRTNLWEAFLEPEFKYKLEQMNLTFAMNETVASYHDYSECDVVIAVRDLTERDYLAKPASKLINAWHAGVPALLGPEPGFQALRKTELDYVEISSPEQALDALRRLKDDPGLYNQMVENGRLRAREFTRDVVAARWFDVLSGPVADGFSTWSGRPAAWKSFVRPALFAWQAMRNIREKRNYLHYRDHGFRPISGRTT